MGDSPRFDFIAGASPGLKPEVVAVLMSGLKPGPISEAKAISRSFGYASG